MYLADVANVAIALTAVGAAAIAAAAAVIAVAATVLSRVSAAKRGRKPEGHGAKAEAPHLH